MIKILTLFFALACTACDPVTAHQITNQVIDTAQARTFVPRRMSPDTVKPSDIDLRFACCDGDFCVYVEFAANCDFPNELLSCEWGQSNPDGSVTCYP